MNKKVLLLALILVVNFSFAQDQKFGIQFNGFVKNDFFYDSRQTVSIREGHFLLYPMGISNDAVGVDMNAKPSFNFLSIQTRLTGKITGPDAFGAKTSGVIEADFFGNENANFVDNNGFRLRQAMVKLNWKKSELLFGQYWHPMFIPENFSGVISFNTGVPFQPFSRNPQIRYSYYFGNLKFATVLSSQRDFTSPGGSLSLRNSLQPDANVQLMYHTKNEMEKKEFLAGFNIGYKKLVPRTVSEVAANKFVVDESVSGISGTAFMRVRIPELTFKFQGVYGQNLFDLTMMGGYAVSEIANATTGQRNYNPTNNLSGWAEIISNGSKIQYGVFAGYTKNLGVASAILSSTTSDLLTSAATIRGYNIASVYRVSPRVVFISGKLNFATEMEMTSAAYATRDANKNLNIDSKGVVTESENVTNYRLLFSVIYNF